VLRSDKRVQCLDMDRQFWVGEGGKLNPSTQVHSWREHHEAQFWFIDQEGHMKAHGNERIRVCFQGDYVGMRDRDDDLIRFKVSEASDSDSE